MKGQTRGLKGSGFYRTVSFFPYVIPAIVIGIMWSQIYDPSNGLLNGILTGLGLDMFESFPWLGDERTAMAATIFVIVWSMVGFYMVLFVAAIKDVPAEIFEAARIDGAGRFRIATAITLPLIRDNVQTAWIYLGILALDAFVYMAGAEPRRRTQQLHPGDGAAAVHHRLHQGPVRPGLRHGRRAGRRDPAVRGSRLRRQPTARRKG